MSTTEPGSETDYSTAIEDRALSLKNGVPGAQTDPGQDLSWNDEIVINKNATNAYSVWVYVQVIDHAGNVYNSKGAKFDLVDTKAPTMSSTSNEDLSTYLSKTGDDVKPIKIYRVGGDAPINVTIEDDHEIDQVVCSPLSSSRVDDTK